MSVLRIMVVVGRGADASEYGSL